MQSIRGTVVLGIEIEFSNSAVETLESVLEVFSICLFHGSPH